VGNDREHDRGWEERPGGVGGKAVVVASLAVFLAGLGGLLWYFSATGETAADVIGQYRPRFAEMRAKLRRVAEKLPPPGSVAGDSLPAGLDPKPLCDVRRGGNNTAFLMAEQCADPDRAPQPTGEFDLDLHANEFLVHVRWAGDKSPLAGGGKDSPAKDVARRMEESLRYAYLVVSRPVRFDPPRAQGIEAFTGGDLDLEVFLVDLPRERVIGSFRRSFRPGPDVMHRFLTRNREHTPPVLEGYAYADVLGQATAEVLRTLRRGTGGTFVTSPVADDAPPP